MDAHGIPQVQGDKCTACGDCVDICPKDLISLEPISNHLWVACKNHEFGDSAESKCQVACNACGRCVVDAPEGLITIKDNLALIDYKKSKLASHLAIERCPTGAIVWFNDTDSYIKGGQAKRIIRHQPLPIKQTG